MHDQPSTAPAPFADEIAAALRHWRDLAAYSWDRYLALGRGAVVMHRAELLALPGRTDASSGPQLRPSYVPLEYVPPGDDYRALMREYEPRAELLLVLADDAGEDHLLRLNCAGDTRPSPEECWSQSSLSRRDDPMG